MNFLYQLFSEDLIYALGWTVLHSLWQALAIGLLMAVFMIFLQNKAAKLRYEVAAMSLFLVFVAALTTFLVYYDTAQTAADFTSMTLMEHPASAENATAVTPLANGAASKVEIFVHYFNQHLPLIVLVWLLGACFFLFRLMGGLAYIQRLKYQKNQPAPAQWTHKMQQLGRKLRLKKPVRLVESALATVPMVIGYFKPVILLPVGAVNGLSEAEVEAILAHELAHIYRNDFLINIFLSVIEVLFYFNPAVWWIAANVRTERENCCDDIAIQLCGSSLTYAKALVNLQQLSQSVPGYAMAFAGSKNQLLQRIKRILNQPQTKSNIMEKFTATALLLITVALFSIGAKSYAYNQSNQQQHFADELNRLVASEAEQSSEDISIEATLAPKLERDTTPKRKKSNKQRFIKKSGEGEVEIEIDEGSISRLVIDGEEIPEAELEEYEELIDDLVEEMKEASDLQEAITPPSPTSPRYAPVPPMPPMPPANVKTRKKTIVTEKEENGQTRIVIQSDDGKPTEIIINDDNDFIFIDGTRLEDGDTAVIIDENNVFSFSDDVFIAPDAFVFDWDEAEIANWSKEAERELKKAMEKLEHHYSEDGSSEEMNEALEELRQHQEDLNESFEWSAEEQEQLRKELEEQRQDLREQIKEQVAEQKLQWEERRRAWAEQRELQQREYQDHINNLRQEMEDRARIESERRLERERNWAMEREEKSRIRFNDEIKETIVNTLLSDGLIDDKDNYSFELRQKHFKVNGKKQPAHVAEKYLKLYEQASGHPMSKSGHIIYKNKNGQTHSSFRSSSTYCPDVEHQYSHIYLVSPECAPTPCPRKCKPKKKKEKPVTIWLAPVKTNFQFSTTNT